MKFLGSNRHRTSYLQVLLIYFIILVPLIYIFGNLNFIADDLLLIKSSTTNSFPVFGSWDQIGSPLYRPIVILSLYLDFLAAGFNPFLYYLSNLLIHLFNSVIIYFIAKNFLELAGANRTFKISFICGLIFLVVPQNITNVLWISGRTDLLCGLFVFLSFLYFLKYLKVKRELFLRLSITAYMFGFMCKESAIIMLFYLLLIYLLIKINNIQLEQKINFGRIFIAFISITVFYFIFRYLVFGSNAYAKMGNSELGLLGGLKFFEYGILSLFSPIGALDPIFLFYNKPLLFALVSFVFGCFTILIVLLIWKHSRTIDFISLITTVLLITISLLIYIKAYPQMRLMYLLYPILLIGISLFFSKIEISNFSKVILITSITVLFLIGNYFVIKRTVAINNYYDDLKNVLPSYKEYKKMEMCFLLTPLGRLSETWADPHLDLMYSLKYGNEINCKSSKFEKIVYYEGYSLTNFDTYSCRDREVSVKTDIAGGLAPLPARKFSGNKLVTKNFEIIPEKYVGFRQGIASNILIKFDSMLNPDRCGIIFFEGKELKLTNLASFLNKYSND